MTQNSYPLGKLASDAKRFLAVRVKPLLGLTLLTACSVTTAFADSSCEPQTFEVFMSTPFSSRINKVGDPLQAILAHPLRVNSPVVISSGSHVSGRVVDIKHSRGKESGSIKIRFEQITGMDSGVTNMMAVPNTMDGWMGQGDAGSPVWGISATRSTRLLSQKLQRTLSSDQAVWAQILGINNSSIPDPSTDAFMQKYNRHDVLVGTGDRIQLRMICH